MVQSAPYAPAPLSPPWGCKGEGTSAAVKPLVHVSPFSSQSTLHWALLVCGTAFLSARLGRCWEPRAGQGTALGEHHSLSQLSGAAFTTGLCPPAGRDLACPDEGPVNVCVTFAAESAEEAQAIEELLHYSPWVGPAPGQGQSAVITKGLQYTEEASGRKYGVLREQFWKGRSIHENLQKSILQHVCTYVCLMGIYLGFHKLGIKDKILFLRLCRTSESSSVVGSTDDLWRCLTHPSEAAVCRIRCCQGKVRLTISLLMTGL